MTTRSGRRGPAPPAAPPTGGPCVYVSTGIYIYPYTHPYMLRATYPPHTHHPTTNDATTTNDDGGTNDDDTISDDPPQTGRDDPTRPQAHDWSTTDPTVITTDVDTGIPDVVRWMTYSTNWPERYPPTHADDRISDTGIWSDGHGVRSVATGRVPASRRPAGLGIVAQPSRRGWPIVTGPVVYRPLSPTSGEHRGMDHRRTGRSPVPRRTSDPAGRMVDHRRYRAAGLLDRTPRHRAVHRRVLRVAGPALPVPGPSRMTPRLCSPTGRDSGLKIRPVWVRLPPQA